MLCTSIVDRRGDPRTGLHYLELAQHEVHVWYARNGTALKAWESILSPAERRRTARFRFDRDRDRFTFTRGVLRYLLARYERLSASELQFAEGEFGKPELAPASPMRFNVSHSDGAALFAFARLVEVGVDIQSHLARHDCAAVARVALTALELERWRSIEARRQAPALYDLWSAKEALLKAAGIGLSVAPCRIPVPEEGTTRSVVVSSNGGTHPAIGYRVTRLPAWSGFSAAVAYAGEAHRIVLYAVDSAAPTTTESPESNP